MDHWMISNETSESVAADAGPSSSNSGLQNTNTDPRQKQEMEVKDPRKLQKTDREKLRRDRLNEQFRELGNKLDPDRPKNDKVTILTDTIQMLKDLTAEVNRLRTECAALSEESRELIQEKHEQREEKASLKSDIENLNVQYQQRLRIMSPWAGFDPSVVMAPPYSYPIPVTVRPGSIPMHPSLQPFPFFGNQNPDAIPNPSSNFIQYSTPTNPSIEQLLTQYASSSHVSSKPDSRNKSLDHQNGNNAERSVDSNDYHVATDLELKMPGSSTQQDTSSGERKGKQTRKKERSITNGSSPSRFSSSQGHQDSSSYSVGDVSKSNK